MGSRELKGKALEIVLKAVEFVFKKHPDALDNVNFRNFLLNTKLEGGKKLSHYFENYIREYELQRKNRND